MEEIEIRRELLISIQRALWGMIYPSIRSIAVGFDGLKKLKIIFYLYREPNEDDYETISEVAGEVCADINFFEVEEICIYRNEPFSKLNNLMTWVYMRKE
jgi:hypothetical protein